MWPPRLVVGALVGVLAPATLHAGPGVQPGTAVAIWYRGTPAGVPVQDELALVRALGFNTIVWPFDEAAGRRELDRIAGLVSLNVVRPPAPEDAAVRQIVLRAGQDDEMFLSARAWLAIADGARAVFIDSGSPVGSGLEDPSGRAAPWVRAAQQLAREVEANAELIMRLSPGPAVDVDTGAVRIALLDGGRAWTLVVVNPTARPAVCAARFPRSVPYGPWVSLIDGTDMAMIVRPDRHEYRATLAPGEARVYVIDKVQKQTPSASRPQRPAISW